MSKTLRVSVGNNFTPLDKVLLAVAEDDIDKFENASS